MSQFWELVAISLLVSDIRSSCVRVIVRVEFNALPDTISVISEAEVSAQACGRVSTLAHGPQSINHVFMPWSNTHFRQFSKLLKAELFPSY